MPGPRKYLKLLFGYPQVGISLANRQGLLGPWPASDDSRDPSGPRPGGLYLSHHLAGACLKLANQLILDSPSRLWHPGAAGTTLGFALSALLNLAALRSLLKVEL